MKNFISYIENNLVRIAIYTLILGIVIILIFSSKSPFNDWSFDTNPELFGLYGNFIGGFVGTLFSLVAVLLLYKTLVAQQSALKKQDKAINNQKETSEIERFETTFFNLLRTQQEITDGIKTYFHSLNNNISKVTYTVKGREFFVYSKNELKKIWNSIESKTYLGSFDEDYAIHVRREMDFLHDPSNLNYVSEPDAISEEKLIIREEKLKFTNTQYGITKEYWERIHGNKINKKLEVLYGLFFQRYHYVIGHYYRHLYHIINFVSEFENSRNEFKGISKRYIDFIQAQMSSYELMLLFYNANLFPKLMKLIIDFNFLENLSIEDLIDKSHNCVEGVRLKERKKLIRKE